MLNKKTFRRLRNTSNSKQTRSKGKLKNKNTNQCNFHEMFKTTYTFFLLFFETVKSKMCALDFLLISSRFLKIIINQPESQLTRPDSQEGAVEQPFLYVSLHFYLSCVHLKSLSSQYAGMTLTQL